MHYVRTSQSIMYVTLEVIMMKVKCF